MTTQDPTSSVSRWAGFNRAGAGELSAGLGPRTLPRRDATLKRFPAWLSRREDAFPTAVPIASQSCRLRPAATEARTIWRERGMSIRRANERQELQELQQGRVLARALQIRLDGLNETCIPFPRQHNAPAAGCNGQTHGESLWRGRQDSSVRPLAEGLMTAEMFPRRPAVPRIDIAPSLHACKWAGREPLGVRPKV